MADNKFDPNKMHFFYKHNYLGSCEPGDAWCPKLLDAMESDTELSTLILEYLNSLGDPVFPVSEEDWGTPETDITKIDIKDLYNTFLQELDYEYKDFPDDFYVDIPDPNANDHLLEIFTGEVAEENVVESSTEIKASKFDGIPGYTPPKGGYLYIFKHGIGPGTIPDDVGVIKVKDLPNYYTAVWLDRFLTTPELKQYDIPDETRINELLGRIGYCQKNGDVVPCDDVQACGDIKASTMPKPTVDDVLKLIADKKIIFKNDVAYWSRGKGVLPKEYRDCIAQTEYAHWINEWSCEQAEKFGDRAYYDYDGEVEVDSCSTVTASTTSESLGLEPRQRTAVDGKTWWVVYDTVARKYLDTLMYFGKYKTKKDCQYAIDRAIEKYGDDLNRTIRNHRKYFSNPGNADKVTASTIDSDIVNTIYSVMMNYEYGYDPDMTDINSMLQELTSKGVHVDTSAAFKRAWVSAHNKAERKTWGSSGDANHYDSLTPREFDAIENYDTEYWEYVKDHPFNLKSASATDVTSSTKYTADMCSVGASDDGYEQLAEGDDADVTWTEPKYHAYSYYGKNYSGLEDDFSTDDPTELVDWIWEHAAKGGYVEVDGPKNRIRLDPDDLAEQVELGGIDEYGIISQIDDI